MEDVELESQVAGVPPLNQASPDGGESTKD